jgi:hypothetical protein
VTASGDPPLTYQWRFNGSNVPGKTLAQYTVPNAQEGSAGLYSVLVSHPGESLLSSAASLTVLTSPVITAQPQNLTTYVGQSAVFYVMASGSQPLAYQWQHYGTNLPGATTNGYQIPVVEPRHAGPYRVAITNACGSVTSAVANLTVIGNNTVIIAQWNFNSPVPDGAVGTGTLNPSVGSGSSISVGSVSLNFTGGSPGDPAASDNSATDTRNYPPATSANKTAGMRFIVSTGGYQDIVIRWDQWTSFAASKYFRLQYATQGINFLDTPAAIVAAQGGTYQSNSVSLASISAVNNNPSFGLRIVAEFEWTATGSGDNRYIAPGGSYSSSAGVLFDMVTISGVPIFSGP